jgi:excisionase family DNA binding protein
MTATADSPTHLSDSAAYLSARQAAEYCGVSEKTIRNWLAAGRLSAEKSADGFRITAVDLAPFRRGSPQAPHHAEPSAEEVRAESRGADAATVNLLPALADALQLVRELQTDLVAKAEAAAMWQARADMLAAQLAALQQPALEAGTVTQSEAASPPPWWRRWRWWRSS